MTTRLSYTITSCMYSIGTTRPIPMFDNDRNHSRKDICWLVDVDRSVGNMHGRPSLSCRNEADDIMSCDFIDWVDFCSMVRKT